MKVGASLRSWLLLFVYLHIMTCIPIFQHYNEYQCCLPFNKSCLYIFTSLIWFPTGNAFMISMKFVKFVLFIRKPESHFPANLPIVSFRLGPFWRLELLTGTFVFFRTTTNYVVQCHTNQEDRGVDSFSCKTWAHLCRSGWPPGASHCRLFRTGVSSCPAGTTVKCETTLLCIFVFNIKYTR